MQTGRMRAKIAIMRTNVNKFFFSKAYAPKRFKIEKIKKKYYIEKKFKSAEREDKLIR
jgi:hypothetical protein